MNALTYLLRVDKSGISLKLLQLILESFVEKFLDFWLVHACVDGNCRHFGFGAS